MDARTALLGAAEQLRLASGPELATPLFEDVRSMLIARWRRGKGWPLVLDDPEDADAVWSVLGTFLTQSGTGSVVIVARAKPEGATGEELPVPGSPATSWWRWARSPAHPSRPILAICRFSFAKRRRL